MASAEPEKPATDSVPGHGAGGRKPMLVEGDRLGAYEIEERLGAGGMAEVYRGRHTSLDKRVAIKVLFPELAANEDLRERFLREGRAASRIDHPHIVNVTDVGADGDRVYLVMELLEGETLGDLMTREGVLAPARILDCLIPVIAAVGAAHKKGVVHRDLKPENVFVARDLNGRPLPKVLDFGVSKLEGTSLARVTTTESVLGTPHYMSPEQARGRRDVDGRTDQYAVGIILYEALVGRLPYEGTSAIELIHEVAAGPVRPPRAFTSSVPEDVEAVLMRALSTDADERYPNMEAFGLALIDFANERMRESFRQALEGTVTTSVPPGPSPGTARPTTGRNRGEVRTAAHRKAPSADRALARADEPIEAPSTLPMERRDSGVRTSDSPRPVTPASTIAAPLRPRSAPPSKPPEGESKPPSQPPVVEAAVASSAPAAPAPASRARWGMVALAPILAVVGWWATRPPEAIPHTFTLRPAATVLLDGHEQGTGELVTVTVPDDAQRHHVEIRAEGYDSFEADVLVHAMPSHVTLDALPPPVVPPPVVAAPPVAVPSVAPPDTAVPPAVVEGRTPRTPRIHRPDPPPHTTRPPQGGDLRLER